VKEWIVKVVLRTVVLECDVQPRVEAVQLQIMTRFGIQQKRWATRWELFLKNGLEVKPALAFHF